MKLSSGLRRGAAVSGALLLALALGGCVVYPGYGYGPGAYPAYGYAAPPPAVYAGGVWGWGWGGGWHGGGWHGGGWH